MFESVNPFTESIIGSEDMMSTGELNVCLSGAEQSFQAFRDSRIAERAVLLLRVASILEKKIQDAANTMAIEMGKPVMQGRLEIQKCVDLCRYYAKSAEDVFLNEKRAGVYYEPSGVVLGITPWNFPFWQVFRVAVPNLMVGNAVCIKPAPNIAQSAHQIDAIFKEAGTQDRYQTLWVSHSQVESVIQSPVITGVSFTGSHQAGAAVAAIAGKALKKVVLELGGSDPFIVCEDAPISAAIEGAVRSRFNNAGQVCIAAKRFIVHKQHYSTFLSGLEHALRQFKIGDPLDLNTTLGPLAREDIRKNLVEQVTKSVALGAKVIRGGRILSKPKGWFYEPTILTDISLDMPVWTEETFGPVAVVITYETDAEAIKLANNTAYGLGASIWSEENHRLDRFVKQLEVGVVGLNEPVKSVFHLPFGGVKQSGFGRELGKEGLFCFSRVKTVLGRR